MNKRQAAAVGAAAVLGSAVGVAVYRLPLANSAPRLTQNVSVPSGGILNATAANGGSGQIRCPNGIIGGTLAQSPFSWSCVAKPPPLTTTTVAPTTTTLAPTTTTQATTTTLASTTTVAPTTTTVPAASLVTPASLFGNSDLFNQVASAWPVDTNSATLVQGFVKAYTNNFGGVGETTQHIYYAPPGIPNQTVNLQTTNCGGGGGSLNGANSIPIPASLNAVWNNSGSSDNPLMIYQPSANNGAGEEWELWQARYNFTSNNPAFANVWSACFGGTIPMGGSNGILPHGGLSATRISYVATNITEDDVASGVINHAMAVDLPDCNGYVYPATAGDCGSDAGYPAEGQYFIFSPSVNCAAYTQTALQNMVCVAGKKFGFVNTDFAGAVDVNVESSSDWFQDGNPGTGPAWCTLSGGQVVICTPGTDPISQASIMSNGMEAPSYSGDIMGNLPWSQLEVVDPPTAFLSKHPKFPHPKISYTITDYHKVYPTLLP